MVCLSGVGNLSGGHRFWTPWLVLLAFVIAGAAVVAPTPAPAAAAPTSSWPCELDPVKFRSSLAALGTRGKPSWVSGDGFVSARVDEDHVIFLNSDTWWGTTRDGYRFEGGGLVNNMLLVHDRRNPECFTPRFGAGWKSLFPGPSADRWLWLGTPTVNDRHVVFPASVVGRLAVPPPIGEWDFELKGTQVLSQIWDGQNLVAGGPTRRLSPTSAEPPGGTFQWVGALVDGDWVYLTPTHMRPGQRGHDVFLARVPANVWFARDGTEILPHLHFRTRNGWTVGASYGDLLPVTLGDGGAMASMTMGPEEVHLIFKEFSILGTQIVDYHAPTFDGPFRRHLLAEAPKRPFTHSYWAVVHPSLGSNGLSRRVTVNFGDAASQGWDFLDHMDRGRPEMIEVVLPEVVRIATGQPDSAVAVNLTVTGSNRSGYVTAYPCDSEPPLASNVNFTERETFANAAVVRTNANGEFCVYTSAGVHVVVDGWGTDSISSVGSPIRRLDTREATGPTAGQRLPAGGVVEVATGLAGGTTILGNVTVTSPTANGYTTVYPCDVERPLASMNNFVSGQTSATFTAVRADPQGKVCIYTSASTHVVFDVTGSSSDQTSTTPDRRLDTREATSPTGGQRLGAGKVIAIPTTSGEGPVLGSLTVAGGLDRGYVTAFPCNMPLPATSTVNFPAMTNRANLVVSDTDARGNLCVYTTADVHIVFDEMARMPSMVAQAPQRLRDTRLQ